MTYLKLKNDRLRISLTRHETEQIFGTSEKIDKNDPRTRVALKLLLKRAISSGGFQLNCNSIWIEIAKNISGGYDIYFIKGKGLCDRPVTFVLEFQSCEAAIGAAKILKSFNKCNHSSFYRMPHGYRIIAETRCGVWDVCGAIEFADGILSDETDIARTKEFGKEIIKENAIELLATL